MKNKAKSDLGRINVVQVETMQALGFELAEIYIEKEESRPLARWIFNIGGIHAVHNFALVIDIDWVVKPKDVIAFTYHQSWARGYDDIRKEIKRVLKVD